ncbi:hypothetical protein GJ744_009841 [Endocarpon pusillum]|uniref:Uncharacterized protein n=1 Tax=Endocarpon pusillum TaxID=364733 RepID=A0A8H7AQ58_9EURO|nr:hypothetical protein GJ744_009841 [Endocarpon pusillum]
MGQVESTDARALVSLKLDTLTLALVLILRLFQSLEAILVDQMTICLWHTGYWRTLLEIYLTSSSMTTL